MKFLGTHHDTGVQLPSVGNAIWLSYYLGQYKGVFVDFMNKCPADAGIIQKDIYIDKRTYNQQLNDAKGVNLIVLCVRCLPGEVGHFMDCYRGFTQQLLARVYRLGYKNVKVELFSEPIEIVSKFAYHTTLKDLRKSLDHYRRKYNLQILAGAGDLHHKQHQNYYKYLRDHGFHDFDCWSIHCINDPMMEMIWAVKNLGDKPIHITEFTVLDQLLAWGASDPKTLWFLNECITFAQKQSKIKSLLQVFPAQITGKYKDWSIHKSAYLTKLRQFYNKYIKEETVSNQDIKISYGEKGLVVKGLQILLNMQTTHELKVDGIFGKNTLAALNTYQDMTKLEVKNYCDVIDLMSFLYDKDRVSQIVRLMIHLKTK